MATLSNSVPVVQTDRGANVNVGLHSPPDSNKSKPESDSELSDLEDNVDDIGDIEPDHYADQGRVPVFKPSMAEFKDFQKYVRLMTAIP